jgi:hypothetical protein
MFPAFSSNSSISQRRGVSSVLPSAKAPAASLHLTFNYFGFYLKASASADYSLQAFATGGFAG